MHLIALTLIATSIYQRLYKVNTRKLITWGVITISLYIVSIYGVKKYLAYAIKDAYNYDQLIVQIPPRFESKVKFSELKKAIPNPVKIRGWQSRLSRIRSSKVLRVGFVENYLPFSYRNIDNQLIGYDIEMAKMLAESLNVSVVFVPVNLKRISNELKKDYYDIVMSGVPLSSELVENVNVSHSYMDLNLALLTKSQTQNLKDYDNASNLDSIRVAYIHRFEFVRLMQSFLPKTGAVKINSVKEYIEADTAVADGMLTSAESGAFYSLLYPEYSIVNPFPEPITIPVVYPVGFESEEFVSYVNNWIIVNAKQGKLDKLYDHWILGKQVTQPKKNWSVVKDVLHWVE